MYEQLIGLPRPIKGTILLVADLLAALLAFYVALMLRLNMIYPWYWVELATTFVAVLCIISVCWNLVLRMYAIQLGSFDLNALVRVALWAILVSVSCTLANLIFDFGAPRTAPVIMGPFLLLFSLAHRFLAINILKLVDRVGKNAIPVAVYGAGSGGLQLVSALRSSKEYRPVFFVDESKRLQGVFMSGLRVYSPKNLGSLLDRYNVEKVFIAIPSISATKKKALIERLQSFNREVLELPSYVEIIESGGMIDSLRPITPDQLLGRNNVELETPEITSVYQSQNIMVSGAGGSIGSELCRKIASIKPKRLVLYEMSEFALYSIDKELQAVTTDQDIEIVSVLGSVENRQLLDATIAENDISIVLHAAAYKHVPLIEANEIEGARNNVLGTKILADAALDNGVERFILISTDKAVRPTNIMGATKRLAELLIQDMQERSDKTTFSIVRFGNVLGSSGSVIPLFKEQIENGGPITVTDTNVTRFFMTIPEAARLVLLCGATAEGGDVFVLDMGEPVKIMQLARQMIELAGRTVRDESNPDGDIEIKQIGLRPGEKLYEELLIGDNTLPTSHEKILRARERKLTSRETSAMIKAITKAIERNDAKLVRDAVKKYVQEYSPPQTNDQIHQIYN